MLSDHPMRRAAQFLGWLGVLALLGGAITFALRLQIVPGVLVAGGLIAIGINSVIGRELVMGAEPRSFTVRGPVVRGEVDARAGMNNLTLGACPNDRIATMRYGPFGNPGFEVKDGVAAVDLRTSLFRPNIAHWAVDLAGNVLWDVETRSFAGDMWLDLTHLRLSRLETRTAMGHITVQLPERGYVEMNLRIGIGRLELAIPPQTGVRIVVYRKQLATLEIHNERLVSIAPDRYTTPGYDEAPGQADIRIFASAGDVVIREQQTI